MSSEEFNGHYNMDPYGGNSSFEDEFLNHLNNNNNNNINLNANFQSYPMHHNNNNVLINNNINNSLNTQNLIQVDDFDVLADELPGTVYDMDEYKKQIGNNRFEVLVTMYQESFNKNYSKNNMTECDAIVKKIVEVTCHKASSSVHNKGRFLVKPMYSDDQWRQLDDEEAKAFVMQALRTPAVEEEDLGQDEETNEEDDLFAPLPVTSKADFSKTDPPSIDFKSMGLGDNKKRGRRQSLLRRSASEDAMMDKKKGLKNLPGEFYRQLPDLSSDDDTGSISSSVSLPIQGSATFRRHHSGGIPDISPLPAQGMMQRHHTISDLPPSRSLSDSTAPDSSIEKARNTTINTSGTIAHTVQGMDVVLASDCKSFSNKTDIVGNNRLKVMLTLEERRFHTLSDGEQDLAAANLVMAVTEYWKGRILADKGFAYSILNRDESIDAMKRLLSSTPEQLALTLERTGEDIATDLKASLTSSGTSSSSSSTTKKLLAAAPPVPEYLRNASREILNSGKGSDGLSGPEQMQSAALRSIKERAGKRLQAKTSRSTSTGSRGSAVSPVRGRGTTSPAIATAVTTVTMPVLDAKKRDNDDTAAVTTVNMPVLDTKKKDDDDAKTASTKDIIPSADVSSPDVPSTEVKEKASTSRDDVADNEAR